jgi:hypothetical protein
MPCGKTIVPDRSSARKGVVETNRTNLPHRRVCNTIDQNDGADSRCSGDCDA